MLLTSEGALLGAPESDVEGFKLFSLTFLAKNSRRKQKPPHSRTPRASWSRSWSSENRCAASSCGRRRRSSRCLWVGHAGVLGFLRCHLSHCPPGESRLWCLLWCGWIITEEALFRTAAGESEIE